VLLPASYSLCCPAALDMLPPLVTFQFRNGKGYGRGRIAETKHEEVIVVLSGADLDVAYRVEPGNIRAVRALIAAWGGTPRGNESQS
jgi:hypothetical protein